MPRIGIVAFDQGLRLAAHTEAQEDIFNPNCKCIALLSNIKEKCKYPEESEVDLSDESGNVKNLRSSPYKYATELLTEREKFILLRVDRKDTGDTKYVPLLNDADFLTETFLAQLASKANLRPESRHRARSSSSRRTTTAKSNTSGRNASDAGSVKSSKTDKSGKSKGGNTGRAKSRLK